MVNVDILVQEVKLKKWFKYVEMEARHNNHFQETLYISRIKYTQVFPAAIKLSMVHIFPH